MVSKMSRGERTSRHRTIWRRRGERTSRHRRIWRVERRAVAGAGSGAGEVSAQIEKRGRCKQNKVVFSEHKAKLAALNDVEILEP